MLNDPAPRGGPFRSGIHSPPEPAERPYTLASRIEIHGPLSELEAVGWIVRLCKRVETLHRIGVPHGDISAATVTTHGARPDARGVLGPIEMGRSPIAYLSPERLAGAPLRPTDDVWAIGVTLYHMLTGAVPYVAGDEAELLRRIQSSKPDPLSVHGVFGRVLERLVARTLAPKLADRIASLVVLRRVLVRWHPDPGVAELEPLEEAEGFRTLHLASVPPAHSGIRKVDSDRLRTALQGGGLALVSATAADAGASRGAAAEPVFDAPLVIDRGYTDDKLSVEFHSVPRAVMAQMALELLSSDDEEDVPTGEFRVSSIPPSFAPEPFDGSVVEELLALEEAARLVERHLPRHARVVAREVESPLPPPEALEEPPTPQERERPGQELDEGGEPEQELDEGTEPGQVLDEGSEHEQDLDDVGALAPSPLFELDDDADSSPDIEVGGWSEIDELLEELRGPSAVPSAPLSRGPARPRLMVVQPDKPKREPMWKLVSFVVACVLAVEAVGLAIGWLLLGR